MIISRERGFGYVHIAKCAGSTVREQLRAHDETGGRFSRTMRLDGHGKVNGNHLPLRTVAEFFPEDFAALRAVTSYAMTREPTDRFVSSMAQYVRSEVKREPSEMTRTEVLAEVRKVIDHVARNPETLEPAYVYFARQVDYVDLDGARIVTEVIPVDEIDLLYALFETRHGIAMMRGAVWNPTVTYRFPALRDTILKAKKFAKSRLPTRVYARTRDLAVKALTTTGAPVFKESVLSDPDVRAFVKTHYAADARLFAEASARASRLKEAG